MTAKGDIIRVGVLEDDSKTRAALAALLDGSPGFTLAGAHATAESALRALPNEQPHVMLVDLELPGADGIEFLQNCRQRFPQLECIVLTVHDSPNWVFPALAAGATGYLIKGVAPARLLDAISEVYSGGASMAGHVARLVLKTFRQQAAIGEDLDSLTPRERQILGLLAQGLRYDEIAARLFLSRRTVNTHLHHIYRKLHVRSATGAVARLLGGRNKE
jgi:DNA-binding NarL/FixJ family response regulator